MAMSSFPDFSYTNLLSLRALPLDQRSQEIQQLQQKVEAIRSACKPAPPPMQPSDFLGALAALDLANPADFQNFLRDTQMQDPDSLPNPVPLGTHDEMQYFLLSSDSTIPQDKSDVPNTREIYHSMSHLRAHSVRLGKPLGLNLVYGFGLGRLFHRPTASSPATWDNLDDTGFYILCSATDKSIWAAFDFTPITETGERRTVQPEYGDQYGRLPNDRSNSAIGVQKLFGREWTAKIPPTLDGGDPFRSDMGGDSPIPAKITAKPTLVSLVVEAVTGGRAGGSDSSSSETGSGSDSSS